MDNKELLRSLIDDVINENQENAAATFNAYSIAKIKSIIESSDDCEEEEEEEEEAKEEDSDKSEKDKKEEKKK
jgi:ribosomal protein L12E/L44/L45/RPP1/RPP2